MKNNTFIKVWKKILPFLFFIVLIHFFKDITQDMLRIATPLDLLGDVKEDLSLFPAFTQNVFALLGYLSFAVEAFLLITIPIIQTRQHSIFLDRVVLVAFLFLLLFFLSATLLDPRFRI